MENNSEIMEFEKSEMAQQSGVGTAMVMSREAQEVQMSMMIAKRFPRDTINAFNRITTECTRKSLAEKAMYEYPRGGQMITGPSIHLARAMARCWGNLDSGFKVLEQTAAESTVMAYCWDLETNYRETKIFTVPHIRQTKKGSQVLTDPRDIYEMVANQAARRERSCILAVIPGDVTDAAISQCNVTLAGDGKMTSEDMTRVLVKNFKEQFGVTQEMLEAYIGCKASAFSNQSCIRLRNVYNTLRDGSATVEQYFDLSLVAPKNVKAEKKSEQKQVPARQDAPEPETSKKDVGTQEAEESGNLQDGMKLDGNTGEVKFGDL